MPLRQHLPLVLHIGQCRCQSLLLPVLLRCCCLLCSRQLGLPLSANALQLLLQCGVLHLQRRTGLLQLSTQLGSRLLRALSLLLRRRQASAELPLHPLQRLCAIRPLVLQGIAQRLSRLAQLGRLRRGVLARHRKLLLRCCPALLRCLQRLSLDGCRSLQGLQCRDKPGRCAQ